MPTHSSLTTQPPPSLFLVDSYVLCLSLTAFADYSLSPVLLYITTNTTECIGDITIVTNDDRENDETFNLVLSSSYEGIVYGDVIEVTILDTSCEFEMWDGVYYTLNSSR